MSRRIEIELTSKTGEGWWTWRAAGAKQPRGTVPAELVPADAAVGTVLRAEIESGIDGIEIQALMPVKPARSEVKSAGRIEVVGTPRREADVSVHLVKGRSGQGGERRERRERREPGERGERGERRERAERGERREVKAREPRRPFVSTAYRNAMLAALRPEQLPVAEQLLRGGIPAVRQAIAEQNATAKASGKPEASADAILAMGEELLPVVRLADWKDRAASAQAAGRELRLRDLRAVVAASRTVTMDDEGRETAKVLRDALTARIEALRTEWIARISNALDAGKVLDALRATARAPEPGTRCPADLAVRLAEQAGAAMTAETPAEEWQELLAAVLESPVRRTVKPAGIPADEAAQSAARRAAGSVPELAKLLGLKIPPPPPRRTPPPRPVVASAGGGPAPSP